ncbi:hypothetical protein, partial [Caballeronia sp. BR00000012568055]|uniref:hypothetical protein n=1 Tax=Caballeronia sp. BR00000012568055 TaxID=2918761 RepID=UPI0023F9C749
GKPQIVGDTPKNARCVTLKGRFRTGIGAAAVCVKHSGKFHGCLKKDEADPLRGAAPQGLSAV